MNRHSCVFTAPADADRVALGPMAITSHLVEKHKFSFFVHNFGDAGCYVYVQYSVNAGATWINATPVGATGGAVGGVQPELIPARVERMMEFMFPKGDRFRVVVHGDGAITEGRIEMCEVDFESNLNDR